MTVFVIKYENSNNIMSVQLFLLYLLFQADLSGIKWQKFSSDAAGLSEDPVLSAFTKCLALDILAVWRRAPRKTTESNQSVRVSFVFLFGIFFSRVGITAAHDKFLCGLQNPQAKN